MPGLRFHGTSKAMHCGRNAGRIKPGNVRSFRKTIAKLQQKQEAASTEAGACHVRRENREKELAERKEKCRNKIEDFERKQTRQPIMK